MKLELRINSLNNKSFFDLSGFEQAVDYSKEPTGFYKAEASKLLPEKR